MSSLSIAPDLVATASGNLEALGSALRSATAAAASQTTAIAAPAADEVSAAVTALFGGHAQEFQAHSAQAAAFHDEFVNLLSGGAAQYVSTEIANVEQMLVDTVNAPAQTLLGHPLIAAGQAAVLQPAAPLTPRSIVLSGLKGGGRFLFFSFNVDSADWGYDGGKITGTFSIGPPFGLGSPWYSQSMSLGFDDFGALLSQTTTLGGASWSGTLTYGPDGLGLSLAGFGIQDSIGSVYQPGPQSAPAPPPPPPPPSGPTYAQVPLALENLNGAGPFLVANLSVGPFGTTISSGINAIVDTGSAGLFVPQADIVNFANLGPVVATNGHVTFGTGETYTFDAYKTTVDFGPSVAGGGVGEVVTQPTYVDVVTSATHTVNGVTFPTEPSKINPILGIGPNAANVPAGTNTYTSIVTQALPDNLNKGVIINATGLNVNPPPAGQGYLGFGENPFTPYASFTGAPYINGGLTVTTHNGIYSVDGVQQDSPFTTVGAPVEIDSGGLAGNIPANLIPPGGIDPFYNYLLLSVGTGQTGIWGVQYPITIGSYTGVLFPNVGGTILNSGIWPFLQNPIYISYDPIGVGTISFD